MFKELVVDAVWTRAGVSSTLNGDLEFKQCKWFIVLKEVCWFVRGIKGTRDRVGDL